MKKATKEIAAILKDRGYRVTQPRLAVVETLASSASPLTIADVAAAVSVDEASVYRTVALLSEEKLVETIRVPRSRPKYALSDHHHHHLVCTNCHIVRHIPCNGNIRPPVEVTDFAAVTSHEVTFYGLCKMCNG